MTSAGPSDGDDRPVDLGKADGRDAAEAPFDPYRFGKPDVPPPPEYAPPGYVPDPPAAPTAPPPGGAYPPMPSPGPHPPAYPPQYGGYAGQQGPHGASPYGPAYGTPQPYGPPGGFPGYGAAQGNGKAVAGMVLGILSIVFCWLTFIDLLLVIPALIFSILGLGAAKDRGRGRGQAIAGLICTGVGIVLAVLVTVLAFHLVGQCSGIDRGSPAYDRCIRNNI